MKRNADDLLKLPREDRNVRKLFTTASLVECGFLKEGVRLTPPARPPSRKVSRKRKGKEVAALSRIDVTSDNESKHLDADDPVIA